MIRGSMVIRFMALSVLYTLVSPLCPPCMKFLRIVSPLSILFKKPIVCSLYTDDSDEPYVQYRSRGT